MTQLKQTVALVVLLLALPFAACEDGDGPTGSQEGELTILLTDDPGAVEAAWVQITKIYLQGEGEDGERVVLMDETVTQNLIELDNDVLTLVEDAEVPPGRYSQLRFIIPNACIEVENGNDGTDIFATPKFGECGEREGRLQLTSLDETGLKVNLAALDGAIEVENDDQTLLVDFDVSQSFGHRAGASGMWVMHPVVEATNVGVSGSILTRVELAEGVTLPEINGAPVTLADFQVELLVPDGEGGLDHEADASLGDPDGDGVFQASFGFLPPRDDYRVDLHAPANVTITTDPATPVTVSVDSGSEVTVSITVTSAAESGSGSG